MLIIYSEDPNIKPIELDLHLNDVSKYYSINWSINVNIDDKKLAECLYFSVEKNGKRWADIGYPEVEDIIGKDPMWASRYAKDNLKCRWADIDKPEVEDIIGRNPEWAYFYAQYILHCRWADIGKTEVEDIIGKNAEAAYRYAKLILKCRWADIGKPEVEDVIRINLRWGYCYARDVIKCAINTEELETGAFIDRMCTTR